MVATRKPSPKGSHLFRVNERQAGTTPITNLKAHPDAVDFSFLPVAASTLVDLAQTWPQLLPAAAPHMREQRTCRSV